MVHISYPANNATMDKVVGNQNLKLSLRLKRRYI